MRRRLVYGSLSVFAMALAAAHAADPGIAGPDVFSRRCSGCHALDLDKEGPHLRGIIGRRAGSAPGFAYSDALRNSGIIWTEPLLDKWLERTQALAPGNDMEFNVARAEERTAVIAWLKSQQDK